MRRNTWICTLAAFALIPGCEKPAAQNELGSPATASSSETRNEDSTAVPLKSANFGNFSFALPAGWELAPDEKSKTKAKLIRIDTANNEVDSVIMVDVGKPAAPTVEGMAELMARNIGGVVSPEPVSFDGISAIRITTPSRSLDAPGVAYVLFQDGQVYMIMGAGPDVAADVEHVRESWKWIGSNVP